ncbi:MAG: polyprenol monophosphomannose synthase [Isosphaeraceae bacterium]
MAGSSVDGPSLSIVIPTRNEAENVEALIDTVCAAIPGFDKELIFVDDSDDATPSLLRRLLPEADCPGLIVERSSTERAGGLSTAVVEGFANASGAYLCVMDADLQHPPSAIPVLWMKAEREGADIAVGSRFMAGGSSKGGLDGLQRHAVSRGARFLARLLLPPARATSDPLSGFFVVHRRVVQGVDLRPIGYKILLEVLVRGRWQKVIDIPYVFHARHAGLSKATTGQGANFVRHLASLAVAARFGKVEAPTGATAYLEGAPPPQDEAEEADARRSSLGQALGVRLPVSGRTGRGKGTG